MTRSWKRLLVVLLAVLFIAAACGDSDDDGDGGTETTAAPETTGGADTTEAPDTTGGADTTAAPTTTGGTATTGAAAGGGEDVLACQVSDTGGIDDRSFNQTAYAGMQRAESELGTEIAFLESQDAADFAPNIQSFIDQDCDIIITAGFLLGDATLAAAQANPDQLFGIVDFAFFDEAGQPIEVPNVRTMNFQTDQAAFLAGYLAAGMTETGVVGTYGGINLPTVTIFMEGFRNGVLYHNEQKGTEVQVLGWDGTDGLFTGNFESTDDGRAFGQNLIDEGADIILPVAGPVGLGTAAVAQEVGGIMLIGVDTDQFVSVPEFGDVFLTSIEKKMDNAVFDTIQGVVETGGLTDTAYIGTLENDGVALSPFHDFEDAVPQELIDELEQVRTGIVDGSISVSGA
jgi:basic membrane protein A